MPASFDSTRKLKETIAWVVLSIAIIVMGVFAIQVLVNPSEKDSNSRDNAGQTKQETKKTDQKEQEKEKKKDTSKEKPKGIGKIRVLVDGLNLRSAPERKGNNSIASLPTGTELTVLSETDNWYEVVNEDGVKGYVSSGSQYVEVISMNE